MISRGEGQWRGHRRLELLSAKTVLAPLSFFVVGLFHTSTGTLATLYQQHGRRQRHSSEATSSSERRRLLQEEEEGGRHRVKKRDHAGRAEYPVIAAIATYNRIGYVQLCARALRGTISPENVWVFDAASTEYSAEDLRQWFGTPHVHSWPHRDATAQTLAVIKYLAALVAPPPPSGRGAGSTAATSSSSGNQNEKHEDAPEQHDLQLSKNKSSTQGGGVDKSFLSRFLGSTVVLLDSDMVVERNWLKRLRLAHDPSKMEWFSLYHSALHPTLRCDSDNAAHSLLRVEQREEEERGIASSATCAMESLGYAGSVFSPAFLLNVAAARTSGDDWDLYRRCRARGIPMRVLKHSGAAHVGMRGSHGAGSAAEKALLFPQDAVDDEVRSLYLAFLKGKLPERISFESSRGVFIHAGGAHFTQLTRNILAEKKMGPGVGGPRP
ncbi:unnamed protein product [Amoebophrya sp. A25]|nr:unnamed protein product [Amoebophrya sp. A25]|eukprot:GSA25T00023725001.1